MQKQIMARKSKRSLSIMEKELPVKNTPGEFEEIRFLRYFKEHTKEVLPGCIILNTELTLYGAYNMLQRDVFERMQGNKTTGLTLKDSIGRIDVIFEYQGKTFISEIKTKTPYTNSDFWDALKIIGYYEYLMWIQETVENSPNAYPAIMMPREKIKLEHRIVANRLKLFIFAIIKTPYDYRVEMAHNPYSKK